METFWVFSSREIEIGAIPWIAFFFLWFKMMDPSFISCKNLGEEGLSLRVKTHQQLKINGLSLSFVFKYKALRNPSYAQLRISRSWIMWLTLPLLTEKLCAGCWVVMCQSSQTMASGISMLQHFRTNSYDRTAWARHITQLCSSCFRSHYSFCPMTNSTSVTCSTVTSTGKMLGDVSHWWFNGNKEMHHSRLFIMTVVRSCCSGAICQKYLWLHTYCQKIQICFT